MKIEIHVAWTNEAGHQCDASLEEIKQFAANGGDTWVQLWEAIHESTQL